MIEKKKVLKLLIVLVFGLCLMAAQNAIAGNGPLNDFCDDAIALSVGNIVVGDTFSATDDPGILNCTGPLSAPGVWYSVIGTGNTMTASACNDGNPATGSADYDSQISIYCDDCAEPICVAGNDDGPGCGGFSSLVDWPSEAGIAYLILMHGFGGATGNFELAILDDGVPVEADVVCKVDIDIKPGSFPNSINTSKCKGKIPVAIFGENFFDVMTVDVTTLAFGPNSAAPAHDLTKPGTYDDHLQDVNDDSYTDLVSHYQCQETGIAVGDTEACLSFSTLGTAPDSDCFVDRFDVSSGCDDQICEDIVCGMDSYCCNVWWDGLCVLEAIDFCGVSHSFVSCDSVRTVPSQ